MKGRRYGDQGTELAASANATLLMALSTMLRLFAPFLPFVTEEVWSWWREGSVHKAQWPSADEVLSTCGGAEHPEGVEALRFAATVLGSSQEEEVRRTASAQDPVSLVVVRAPGAMLALLPSVEADLRASGLIQRLETEEAEMLQVDVTLAPAESVPVERGQ